MAGQRTCDVESQNPKICVRLHIMCAVNVRAIGPEMLVFVHLTSHRLHDRAMCLCRRLPGSLSRRNETEMSFCVYRYFSAYGFYFWCLDGGFYLCRPSLFRSRCLAVHLPPLAMSAWCELRCQQRASGTSGDDVAIERAWTGA